MKEFIGSIMQNNPLSVSADTSLDLVIEFLADNDLHCAPVVDIAGKSFGVLCRYDIAQLYSENINLKDVRAWEACTHRVVSVHPNTPVEDAVNLMLKNKIHHIIVEENGQLKGLVSTMDILKEYTDPVRFKELTNIQRELLRLGQDEYLDFP